ncbi:IclR family transcriptional regulator [Psychrobacillus sp. NPDC093180]|uniref:IclR family transcriptional regulator n=1 Tax=Psychrobacillus sp. NPDC093180 TaxID=3364489 RepID=UPI0037FFB65D
MKEETFKSNYSMSSIHRVIQVLRAFSIEHPKLSLTEISKRTEISLSSLQRIVSTLAYEGFLVKDEKTKQYSLGLELMFLGQLVTQNDALLSRAIPIMEELNDQTKENVSLNIIEHDERRCIYNLPSRHELSALTFVGHTSPLYAGASAKILLAYQDNTFIQNFINMIELKRITDSTVDSKESLLEQLSVIRNQGYAMTKGERVKGAMSISVPIFAKGNLLLGTLSVTFPVIRQEEYDIEELICLLKDAAKRIMN